MKGGEGGVASLTVESDEKHSPPFSLATHAPTINTAKKPYVSEGDIVAESRPNEICKQPGQNLVATTGTDL